MEHAVAGGVAGDLILHLGFLQEVPKDVFSRWRAADVPPADKKNAEFMGIRHEASMGEEQEAGKRPSRSLGLEGARVPGLV